MTDPVRRLAAALADRYAVERELGQGGMATVYLAHDIRHDRRVALKVLRPELSAILGAERFLAEIKTTANLQHPHILSLFDSGEADGLVYYVMPYVEGESLRDRLNREKQLPVEDAVRIAREVADALEYAHQHGIVHRDIKPENILLHGGHAMVADFGIALAASRSEGSTRMTETGMSLGTPHYMAPEQAMGEREITPKADIYALGCVLYEMLTAEPPFVGATAQAIIARVMTEEPRSLTMQRHTIPPAIESAVRKALEKLPADRFASAAEMAAALGNPAYGAGDTESRGSSRQKAGWAARLRDPVVLGLAAVTVVALVLAAASLRQRAAPAGIVVRFQLPLSAEHGVTGAPINTLAFSPDGRTMVYVGRSEGTGYALYERRLDEVGPFRAIPGTENATFPAFSPDGNRLAYIVLGRLFVTSVPFASGAASPVGSAGISSAVVWLDDHTLAVNNDSGGIDRVDLSGASALVARRDSAAGERNLWVWSSVPGKGTLFAVSSSGTGSIGRAFAVDARNGHRTPLLQTEVSAVWYANGFLLWSLPSGTLQAAPYDVSGKRLAGSAVTLADGVMQAIGGGGQVAFSSVGSLVFLPEQAPDLVLLDRTGRSDVVGQGRRFHSPRLSPDGVHVAYDFIQQGMRDVWTFDLRQRTLTRLSFENDGHDPVWSPDGRWIYYVHGTGMWRRRADGGGVADSVFTGGGQALEVEKNGSILTASTASGSLVGGFDVSLWSPDSPRVVKPLLGTPYSEQAATLSPDQRWLAYSSDETGKSEVYVRSFPEGGAKVLVSRGGGSEPAWSPDGRTLYYRGQSEGRSVLVAATVVPGREFSVAARAPLFDVAEYEPAEPHRNWDISADGRHFAMVHQGTLTQMNVILNWPEEVRRQSAAAGQGR